MRRSQAINAFGFSMTALVLVVILVTKFTQGAWISLAAMAAICALMTAIRRHYDRVSDELRQAEQDHPEMTLPSPNHAVVLVSTLHLPTRRALAYAKATRPDVLEAITVNVDDKDTRQLVDEWTKQNFSIPLKVIESPYREITKPVLDYVKRIRTDNPRDVVTVFIPDYVVGRWWEQLLHNQSALRLKTRLLFNRASWSSACRGSSPRPTGPSPGRAPCGAGCTQTEMVQTPSGNAPPRRSGVVDWLVAARSQ